MTQLLVSVRSVREAKAALRGGAALIDVKEPAHGSLGRANDDVIVEVAHVVAGRRPISAALGELRDALSENLPPTELPLAYVKWGLAGCRDTGDAWIPKLDNAMRRFREQLPRCRPVAVAYADWRRAAAPSPDEVCSFAIESSAGAFLIDTWQKDGSTLLNWLSLHEIERLQERSRTARVPLALAGSLGPAEIRALLPLRPDWIAVRGAVCQGWRRESVVEESRVRRLAELVGTASPQRKHG